ncbi:MAG: hypothetical protein WKF65_02325 [Gaiellaceae bacterium]
MSSGTDGACVIRYDGKRGVVWRLKYRDAGGRQVQETLGRAADGWSKRKAEQELQARLTDVQRDGLRRVDPTLFETFAREWDATYPVAKGLKRSTRAGYTMIFERHLIPAFGPVKLEKIDAALVERYVTGKRLAGFAPRTINRHLNLLHKVLSLALRRQLIRVNPVGLVDRPREPRRRWTILAPAEVVRVERGFAELVEAAEGPERAWREQARVVFVTVMGTGVRRGELLGLRWRNVHLADPEGAATRCPSAIVRSPFSDFSACPASPARPSRRRGDSRSCSSTVPGRRSGGRRARVLPSADRRRSGRQAVRTDAAPGSCEGGDRPADATIP